MSRPRHRSQRALALIAAAFATGVLLGSSFPWHGSRSPDTSTNPQPSSADGTALDAAAAVAAAATSTKPDGHVDGAAAGSNAKAVIEQQQVAQQPLPDEKVQGSAGAAAAVAGPAAAAAAAGLQRNDLQYSERSRRWAPMVLNRCTPDMPKHYAPCLVGSVQDPHVAYAEEVIYPDFSIPEPHFLSEEHAAFWRSTVKGRGDYLLERFSLWHGRAYYTGQRGQNVVLRNISFKNNPPSDTWDHVACTKPGTTHRFLVPLQEGEAPQWTGRAVLANTPDGAYFQHFMDRLTNVLLQSEGWRLPGTKIAAGGQPTSQHVRDVWPLLTAGQEVVYGATRFSVEELVFSCRTPYRHPFFRMRLQELAGLPDPAPIEQRRVVLYFTRSKGDSKPERSVLNEDEVLHAIRGVLAERNKGEELVVAPPASFPRAMDIARFLHLNVSAIIGPHGGALTNLPWAAPHTLVIEFSPSSRPHHTYWAESNLAQARYWCIIVNSTAPQHHMRVDPDQVAGVLRKELGQRGEPEEYIMPFYYWENTLEGQIGTDGWR